MSGWLSGSKQEQQQFVVDIERLTSDKADLFTRLQRCEEDLKTANELLRMREKAVSGMMAAVHRRDTDVEEREERISHLKKELEELRREGVESGGRESREIEDLKSKLVVKTDELNEAIKRNSELNSQVLDAARQLKDKDDKINGLETRLKNPENTTANLHNKSSQTELAIKTESLPSKSIAYLTQLSISHGMVISRKGHLIVTDWSKHCITIINTASGEKIFSFGQFGSGQVEFDHSEGREGVSLTRDGHIVVADSSNHRLQVLTVEGAFVAAVGSRGFQPLQFHYPRDVAVDRNGKVYVTELWNHRVQVLNPDLSYSHCFGGSGDKLGQLYGPRGIAIDQDGMVYVSDYGNHRIQKFTPKGFALAAFEHKKMRSSFCPYGLCFDSNNLLYVTDMQNNIVCVFNTTSGQFLGYIGNSDGSSFNSPRFIVSDKDRVYISDYNGVITYKCFQQ